MTPEAPPVDEPAAPMVQPLPDVEPFDRSNPEIRIDKFAKVRFVPRPGQVGSAFYAPQGATDKDEGTAVEFSSGRGFPLREAGTDLKVKQLDWTLEQRQVIADIERFDGCDRLELKALGQPVRDQPVTIQQWLSSSDGQAVFILNSNNQLIRVNLQTWLVEAAVLLPGKSSKVCSCRHGIVALADQGRYGSSRAEWLEMGAEEKDLNTRWNGLFLLSEETLEVQASAPTQAVFLVGHPTSPLILLSQPSIRQWTAINTTHWELIDSFPLEFNIRESHESFLSVRGFRPLRNMKPEDCHQLPQLIQTELDERKKGKQHELVVYSEDESKALVYRKDVSNIVLCDVENLDSIDNLIFENAGRPYVMGLHQGTQTYYRAFRGGGYNFSPTVMRVRRGGAEAEVDLGQTRSHQLWVHPGGRGAFVEIDRTWHWLQPTLKAAPAAAAIAGGPKAASAGSVELIPYLVKKPKEPLVGTTDWKVIRAKMRSQLATQLPGTIYYLTPSQWYEWDPDGRHFYAVMMHKDLICFDTETNKEVVRIAAPGATDPFYLLSEEGIIYWSTEQATFYEYKTLKPRWRIKIEGFEHGCQDLCQPGAPLHCHAEARGGW